jgi:hypothetical protein
VGGSEAKSGLGSDLFFDIFLIVFLNSPHRETPKNVINKNREKIGFGFLVELFGKGFRHGLFVKLFLWLPRNAHAQKRTKKSQEKKTDGGWVGLGFSKCTGGGGVRRPPIFFAGPSGLWVVGLR